LETSPFPRPGLRAGSSPSCHEYGSVGQRIRSGQLPVGGGCAEKAHDSQGSVPPVAIGRPDLAPAIVVGQPRHASHQSPMRSEKPISPKPFLHTLKKEEERRQFPVEDRTYVLENLFKKAKYYSIATKLDEEILCRPISKDEFNLKIHSIRQEIKDENLSKNILPDILDRFDERWSAAKVIPKL